MFLPPHRGHILSIDDLVDIIEDTWIGDVWLDQVLTVEVCDQLSKRLYRIDRYTAE